jgi:hypothetical protein
MIPYCTHDDPYTETATPLRTVGDVRRLIGGLSDDLPVYIFGIYGYDTIYDAEGEYKTQECIEHGGRVHKVTGLIIQVEG